MTDGAANSPKTGTGRHELPTELETPLPAALYLNLNQCAAAPAGMEHNGVQIGHPLLLFPLPLPPSNSGRSFQRGGALPSSLVPRPLGGWFPKAGAKAPGLCVVSRGCGGKSKSPAFLFRGAGGTFSFQKRISPLASRPGNRDCPLWEQRKCGGHSARQSRVIHAPHSGALVLLDQFKMD